MPLTNDLIRSKFDGALPYDEYVATGDARQRDNWTSFHASVSLTDAQHRLVSSFTRRINVVVSSGIWCGDCVQQCPMFDHIERANPEAVKVRFVDRDEHADLAEKVQICGGLRVPMAVFANEDFDLCALYGDRSLTRYRALAAKKLGTSCPLPGAPVEESEIAGTLQDWIDVFERVHLMFRTSTKLRERHGD